ncbi:MAG: hypothetical protein ACI4Q0_03900 [Oligosphaeraceae bacterium]
MPDSPAPSPSSRLQAAQALLGDSDNEVASLAMECILKSGKAEESLATLQDTADKNVRKRAHQLGTLLHQDAILRQLVQDYEQARLSALDGMMRIDLLYDTSSSLTFLQEQLTALETEFKKGIRGPLTFSKLCQSMERMDFFVPPLPWLAIEDYLIGDVLDGDGGASPLVLSTLCRHLATPRGLPVTIATCNGFIGFTHGDWVCLPEQGWQSRQLTRQDELCPLHDQQIFQLYLCQMLAGAMASWEAYDVHLFLEIYQSLFGLKGNPLPYPFGDLGLRQPPQPDAP